MNKPDPQFIIYTGPMFSAKTSSMLSTIDRFKYQKLKTIAFKPVMDVRYSEQMISTHTGLTLTAIGVNTGDEIIEYVNKNSPNCDVIAVDEAFMIDGVADALLTLYRAGKTIVVSSLQISASGNVFSEMKEMMPWATSITVCAAVCPITGRDAYYTHRKIDGLDEITVGGAELYEPRCWQYHPYMNLRD